MKVIEKYRMTSRATERARAVHAALPELTEGDITEALKAVELGRRLEAEVGMALLAGYYTEKKEWMRIEDAYKRMFTAVPELRFDPYHILEFAWTLMKLGRFEKALEQADHAEDNFKNLAAGQSTLEFQARLIECRAWCHEGMFRESVSKGLDEDADLHRDRAVQAWEAFRDLLIPHAEESKAIADRIAIAEDHIVGFKRRN